MSLALLLAAAGFGAGLFGSLLGLGGGVILVPLLTIVFQVPLTTAVAVSLLAVIATTAGAAARYLALGRSDVRLAVTLQAPGVAGAAAGGVLAGFLSESVVSALFAAVLVYAALSMARGLIGRKASIEGEPAVEPALPDHPRGPAYRRRRLPAAIGGSSLAGLAAGLLGIGGGVLNVPIMHMLMGVPMAVAVATSNLVIGVTAASGAYVYLFRGDVDPVIAGPVVLGVLGGAALGARAAPYVRTRWIALLFVVALGYAAVRMALEALGGG